jgi:UDP-N-acetylglucosamine--N-acetylmuramyl-(pentapeptide) pyrophosphoryl-undecaprenol N-acetylglucosamine transferase
MSQKTRRIVLSGGVSGGHTFPLLAVAEVFQSEAPGAYEFLFIGPRGAFGGDAMERSGIPAKYVQTGKWRRYFSFANFIDLFRIPIGFFQSLWHLFWFMPDAVFAKGGSATVPVVLAARVYRIPVLIHDSDAVAGRANRFLSRFVQRIAVSYPAAKDFFPAEKIALTGNPVRGEILGATPQDGAGLFHLSADQETLLVVGGSLGARLLNDITLRLLPELLKEGIQVLHLCGADHFEAIVQAVRERGIDPDTSGYRPRPFLTAKELGAAYALASVVVARAGAGAIAELAAYRKAVILVPLASAANDEQRANAHEIAHIGGAEVIEEENLSEHILLSELHEILGNPEKRARLGENLAAFYHPDAARAIAKGLSELMA